MLNWRQRFRWCRNKATGTRTVAIPSSERPVDASKPRMQAVGAKSGAVPSGTRKGDHAAVALAPPTLFSMLVKLSRSSRTRQSSEQRPSNFTGSFSFMICLTSFSSRALEFPSLSDIRHVRGIVLTGFSPDSELEAVTEMTEHRVPILWRSE